MILPSVEDANALAVFMSYVQTRSYQESKSYEHKVTYIKGDASGEFTISTQLKLNKEESMKSILILQK